MSSFVVAGLVRRGTEVLLVRQQGPEDPEPCWALPGGVVEPGELLTEALAREIREETGLEVTDPGRLLYVVQLDWPQAARQYVAFAFDVAGWQGQLHPADPDGLIQQVRFVPQAHTIALLETAPFMRGPILGYLNRYLNGQAGPGAMWLYRRQPDGTDLLVTRTGE